MSGVNHVRPHARIRQLGVSAVAAVSAFALGACAAPAGTVDPARNAASAFGSAVAAGDVGSVCAALTDAAVESLEKGGTSCPSAVAELGLADPGTLRGVEVWGRAALARFTTDVAFLGLVDGRWRVSAAGCTVAGKSPADCLLGGA
jgi:hypothetical protein